MAFSSVFASAAKQSSFFMDCFAALAKTAVIFVLCQPIYAVNAEWLTQALKLQREIDYNAPLNKATFLASHNSYNSRAYQIIPLRYLDPNQTLSIYDQLELGVRSVELDAHWTFNHILLCHAHDDHVGCSPFDREITEGLQEIRQWLVEHPKELVLLYIERHLDGREIQLANALEKNLGEFIYKPNGICEGLPTKISKADILNSDKQLIIVTQGCADSVAWSKLVFAGIGELQYVFPEEPPKNFNAYPDCGKDGNFNIDPDHQSMWHIYEDRTIYKNFPNPKPKIEISTMFELAKCGVNWQALDMVSTTDDRLAASIWSWAYGYPKSDGGDCVIYRNKVGFVNYPCDSVVSAFACENVETGEMRAILRAGVFGDGASVCNNLGADWLFIVPINGAQMYALQSSIATPEVWVNYKKDINGTWVSNTKG